MLYEVTGNLVEDHEFTVFCHQTNCRGVMGAGIAKQIKRKYPIVGFRDQSYCRRWAEGLIGHDILGTVLASDTPDGRICFNLYAQRDYGRMKRQTDYAAFQSCLDELCVRLLDIVPETVVGFPYMIGCGNAGGDWEIIRRMIANFAKKIRQNVYIVRLP